VRGLTGPERYKPVLAGGHRFVRLANSYTLY
jgi:hypothetical protein